ncbi:hypothetical protein CEXT_422201 [Caerostris extrusa]|uniref:Uncharacterized protein n=1 Tax=Caerostris extrusa TaxID=172846 RepID=A0AAV4QBQ2_CAEEX|nr:hypothetical protein CEXT_422201 [Caerostris extrusa]
MFAPSSGEESESQMERTINGRMFHPRLGKKALGKWILRTVNWNTKSSKKGTRRGKRSSISNNSHSVYFVLEKTLSSPGALGGDCSLLVLGPVKFSPLLVCLWQWTPNGIKFSGLLS